MINTDKLAAAIHQANQHKPAFIAQNQNGLYLAWSGNFVKTRANAMRLTSAEAFKTYYPKLNLQITQIKKRVK